MAPTQPVQPNDPARTAGPGDPVLVVLAAGAGERLGQLKALAPLGDDPRHSTPLALLLSAGRGLGQAPACVVGGAQCAALAAHLPHGVRLIENPSWTRGRTGSVQRAARALPGRDLCIAPVDVPLVSREVFEALGRAWRAAGSPPEGWLAPRLMTAPAVGGGRHGHPVLIGRRLLERLPELAPDTPLRHLRGQARPLWDEPVRDPAILDDLDRPADLERLRKRFRAADRGERPGP